MSILCHLQSYGGRAGGGLNAYVEHDEMAVIYEPRALFWAKWPWVDNATNEGNDSAWSDWPRRPCLLSWLEQDPKNRSENMMIVDPLRNDMNRISEVEVSMWSVCVRWSSIRPFGKWLRPLRVSYDRMGPSWNLSCSFFPWFHNGAPKIATMEIIRTWSPNHADYCGTIGLCFQMGTNFQCRHSTIQLHQGKAIYGVGGGITWDSTWESEYREVHQRRLSLS